jgi:hypothetical protein
LGAVLSEGKMPIETIIANILQSSEFDTSAWDIKILKELAHEIVIELIRAGWKIVPTDYESDEV